MISYERHVPYGREEMDFMHLRSFFLIFLYMYLSVAVCILTNRWTSYIGDILRTRTRDKWVALIRAMVGEVHHTDLKTTPTLNTVQM